MKIEFSISTVPAGAQIKYATAYLEGYLSVVLDGTVCFAHPDLLLLEFAQVAQQWLSQMQTAGQTPDLIYETMDHDVPILGFRNVGQNQFAFETIWPTNPPHRLIEQGELEQALRSYLTAFLPSVRELPFPMLHLRFTPEQFAMVKTHLLTAVPDLAPTFQTYSKRIEIPVPAAEALREAALDLLQVTGFDRHYALTREGRILQDIADKLHH